MNTNDTRQARQENRDASDATAKLERIIRRAAEAAAEAAAKRTVQELKRAGALREGKWNEYKHAEQLLRLYGAQRGINAEQAAAVEQALASISGERYADVIQLFYFEKKTNAEIAETLHASERTVGRARQRLVQKISAKVAKN